MSKLDDLLPCPFCGNKFPTLQESKIHPNYHFVRCETGEILGEVGCGCRTDSIGQATKEDAIASWNQRRMNPYHQLQIIKLLEQEGYTIRNKAQANATLSFHSLSPTPPNFEDHALNEIKRQLTKDHVHFEERQTHDGLKVRSCILRML